METGYLQHGEGSGPFHTEAVPIKVNAWPKADTWLAFYEGKWRLVHVQVKRLFIVYKGERITILIEGV
jgi:hypothetical protein